MLHFLRFNDSDAEVLVALLFTGSYPPDLTHMHNHETSPVLEVCKSEV